MPAYPGVAGATVPVNSNLSPIALDRGESCHVFSTVGVHATQLPANANDETILAGTASIAVCLNPVDAAPLPMVCIELHFSAAPGAFELDIQEADTDADAWYITPSNSAYTVTAVNSNNNARVDLAPTGGRFMRVFMKTLTNVVNTRVKLTRLA